MSAKSVNTDTLYKQLESYAYVSGEDVFKDRFKKYQDIVGSLNPKFKLRGYQIEAIGRFVFYTEKHQHREMPYHLLFNMATGSGKTLVMAAAILYLYKKGYRNFIFFTHLSNIIDKTKDNFLNPQSSKYLFAEDISLGGHKISINEVESFASSSEQDINIMFTTMAGLHSKWQNARENGLSPDDLDDKKIVLLGDEAHHFSAKTKKKESTVDKENNNWEYTILANPDTNMGDNRPGLLYVNPDRENILLEFTATLDWNDHNIVQKYNDKVIYRYDLAQFRKDGYSKNVSTLQFDAPYFDRSLAAIVLSQYRLKVSQSFGIKPRPIKPVILFKANRVSEPNLKDKGKTRGNNPSLVVSSKFKQEFHKRIDRLSAQELENIKKISMAVDDEGDAHGGINIKKAFEFFNSKNITLENLAREIRQDFSPENCISVDTKFDVENTQIILNSLEDDDNNIRAVFATEKLNEGWDVLNLFDIVRLYNSRDSKNNKPGNTTTQEAQLIGRGARYSPFVIDEGNNMYKRKFDGKPNNPLAVLERLHYHCTHNPKYIKELNQALEDQGAKDKDVEEFIIAPKSDIPNLPKSTSVTSWKEASMFLNKLQPRSKLESHKAVDTAIEEWAIQGVTFKHPSMLLKEGSVGDNLEEIDSYEKLDGYSSGSRVPFAALELGEHVIRQALGYYPEANFDNLLKHFNNIKSVNSFINNIVKSANNLILITGEEKVNKLSQEDKLDIARELVDRLLESLLRNKSEHVGTIEFTSKPLGLVFAEPKVRQIRDKSGDAYSADNQDKIKALVNKKWFAQTDFRDATDQEVAFLEFIDSQYREIEKRYDYFLVFRNDNHFSIYNFSNIDNAHEGDKFNPDFVMLLQKKGASRPLTHQVFVEAKGPQFAGADDTFKSGHEGWKEDFLKRIENEAKVEVADKNIKLIGMPFFHQVIDGRGNHKLFKIFAEHFKNELLQKV